MKRGSFTMAVNMDVDHIQEYKEEYVEDANSPLMSHTLVERQLENESVPHYYCLQCDTEYGSIDDFINSHQTNSDGFLEEDRENCTEISQWKAIDDIIEYDAPTELENSFEIEQSVLTSEYLVVNDGSTTTHIVEDHLTHVEDPGEEQVIKVEVDGVDNKYYCYDCRTVFEDLRIAEEHDCPGIGNALEEANSSKNLVQNISDQICDELIKYMCAYCEEKFANLPELEQHQVSCGSSHKKALQPEESNPPKVFKTAKALNSNNPVQKMKPTEDVETVRQIDKPGHYACTICDTNFLKYRSLKLHMRIHKERPLRRIQEALPAIAAQKYDRLDHFFCEICNKSFDQNLLAVHKNMHQNFEEYICKTCNRQFKNKDSFEMHQQLHLSDNSTQKPIINTGPTEAALRNARKGIKSMHVANAKETFPCQYCGHLFWRPHEKVRHEYIHTGEKPYPCEVCGKRFRVPYSLTLHLRTHTDIRPYVCANCNKRFKSHSVYTHHMRTHMNDRAYQCDICGKSFRTSVRLCGHKNIHTKPFNCTLCNRPFASLYTLKTHMKSHSKNKVFENLKHNCSICGAVYARTGALRAHMKEMHGVESTETPQSTFYEQNDAEETRCGDEQEADEAAMMLLTGTEFMQI